MYFSLVSKENEMYTIPPASPVPLSSSPFPACCTTSSLNCWSVPAECWWRWRSQSWLHSCELWNIWIEYVPMWQGGELSWCPAERRAAVGVQWLFLARGLAWNQLFCLLSLFHSPYLPAERGIGVKVFENIKREIGLWKCGVHVNRCLLLPLQLSVFFSG